MTARVYFIGAMAVLTVLTGCRQQKVAAKEVMTVRVQQAVLTTVSQEMRFAATVEPTAQVELAFRSAGLVEQLYQVRGVDGRGRGLEPGDRVPAGVVLARVRATEYQARNELTAAQRGEAQSSVLASEAQIREAEAALQHAAADFDRAEHLVKVQAMTRLEFDAAKAKWDTAKARVEAVKASHAASLARVRATEAQQREATLAVDDTALIAPFAAVVVARRVERGQLVSGSIPAFSLADLSRVKVVFGIPDSALPNFRTGTKVDVTFDSLPGNSYRGAVQTVGAVADPVTRTFRVEALVDNRSGDLRAGMVASVVLSGTAPVPAITIPLSALVRGGDNGFAVFVHQGSKVTRRGVRIGPAQGSQVAIEGGVQAGEEVVVDAVARLEDGAVVRAVR